MAADEQPGRSWKTKYGAAVGSLAIGLVLAGIGLASGDTFLAVDALLVMGGLAAIQAIAGRYGWLRSLRGERDEREELRNLRGYQVSALVTGGVLFVLWVRDVFNDNLGSEAQWLLALMGVSYAATLLYYRWRDR
jgi:hypothetical protein